MSWDELQRPAPESVAVGGVELRRGSRVRLRPRARRRRVRPRARRAARRASRRSRRTWRARVHLVVTVDDDPGRDLGVAPSSPTASSSRPTRSSRSRRGGSSSPASATCSSATTASASRSPSGSRRAPLPPGVEVVDYGIRGMDLAYALGEGWDAVVLLDAAPTGQPPGHAVGDRARARRRRAVDRRARDGPREGARRSPRALGGPLPRTLVVACAPETVMTGEEEDVVAELSPPVLRGARRRRRARRVAAARVDISRPEEVRPS